MSADADGIDGANDGAGAFIDSGTVTRSRQAGIDPGQDLAGHSSGNAFEQIGALFVTGPTRTNVNDFRAILIDR
ncbi:MOFRL family protein [Lichenicola cladoniae]